MQKLLMLMLHFFFYTCIQYIPVSVRTDCYRKIQAIAAEDPEAAEFVERSISKLEKTQPVPGWDRSYLDQ